jgi:hypothetical protein
MLSCYIHDMEIAIEDFHVACEQVTISPLLAENVKKVGTIAIFFLISLTIIDRYLLPSF